jgi:hypothetical protein
MVTVAQNTKARSGTHAGSLRLPIWAWVISSRLLVLAVGAAGSLFAQRIPDWQTYDPERLSSSLGSLGNVLTASMVRWDAIGYITLAEHGYTNAPSTRQFPLYPLLIRSLAVVVGSPVIAGVLISLAAFAVGLTLVHRIACEHVGRGAADATVLLIAFSPLSFVFSAIYTESLLLALLAGSFYLADHDRFGWACVCAAAAALTHIQGVLMVAPLALIYWNSRGRTRDLRHLWSPSLLALTLPVLTFGGFLTYMHARGWGWLAPITSQNMHEAARSTVGPPLAIFDAVRAFATDLGQTLGGHEAALGGLPVALQNGVHLAALTVALIGLASAWRRLPIEYALFSALALLVCTSSEVLVEPLQGFGRYMLPVFPLWIGAAAWFQRRRLLPLVLGASTALLILYTFAFTRWASVF